MILPAIVALGSRVSGAYSVEHNAEQRAQMTVKMLAFEAFPQWAQANHEELCPRSIDDLLEFSSRDNALDPWGTKLDLRCGPGYRGAYVRSAGPDGRFETVDDISSND